MGRFLIFLGECLLAIFGITIGKDGVSFQWRRLLLWAVMVPVVGILASVIVTVGGAVVDLFTTLFQDGMPVFGSPVRWVILSWRPNPGTAGFSVWRIVCVATYSFGVDIVLYTILQLILMRMVRSLISHIASYAHGFTRLVIGTVEGKST